MGRRVAIVAALALIAACRSQAQGDAAKASSSAEVTGAQPAASESPLRKQRHHRPHEVPDDSLPHEAPRDH
ncbi:MAG TPA: hypothetical protein VGI39_29870 [Polyangiaceae bacterium]